MTSRRGTVGLVGPLVLGVAFAVLMVIGSAYGQPCDDTSSCPTYSAQLTIE